MLLIKYFKNSELQTKTRKPVLHVKKSSQTVPPSESLSVVTWMYEVISIVMTLILRSD